MHSHCVEELGSADGKLLAVCFTTHEAFCMFYTPSDEGLVVGMRSLRFLKDDGCWFIWSLQTARCGSGNYGFMEFAVLSCLAV